MTAQNRIKNVLTLAVLAMAILILTTTSANAEFLTPVSVTATSWWDVTQGNIQNLISGSGLSENTASGTHDNSGNASTMWFASDAQGGRGGPGVVADQEVIFDLGESYNLSQAYIWNQNQGHAVNAGGARNTRTMDIYVSSDDITYTQVGGTVTLAVTDGTNPALPAEIVPLSAFNVRYVKFDILTAGSGNDTEYVGLSEVRFESLIDPNLPDVDAGISMITWSGEPVQLDPNVVEAPGSDWTNLTYAWSADPCDGVVFSDPGIEAPTVTITRMPVLVPFVTNGGFEDPPLAEDDFTWQNVPGWTPIGHADDNQGVGVWNTTIVDFDPLIAPEGENVLYTEYYVGGVGGVAQILDEKFAADTAYTLTVDVGNSDYYYFSGYKVQVIAEDNDTLWPASKLWATSTVAYTYNPADAALVGQPLEIRLLSLGLDKDNPDDVIGVEFDNVTLFIDGESGTYAHDPEPITVVLTLAVNDEGREGDPVTDTMTIDVYDDACLAAEAAGTMVIDPTDFDGNCITDFVDFALMAATWLDDYALTNPVPE